MNTKDRKEQQLTLIEFNEEHQAFNFNEDGLTPPRDGWMPIAWMPHDEAARWEKTAEEDIRFLRPLRSKKGKITTEEVIQDIRKRWYNEGFEFAMEIRDNPEPIYLVCDVCDEGGADVKAAFTDELTAYHYMDCEGGDLVEEVTLQHDYENHKRRTYRITMVEGQYYYQTKLNIRVVDGIKDFKEKDVKQAIRWSWSKDGMLQLDAYLVGSHRYQIFKNAEKIISTFDVKEYNHNQWYEYPSKKSLTPRELSQFERSIYDCMFAGRVDEKEHPLMGLMDRFIEEYEQFKEQSKKKDNS